MQGYVSVGKVEEFRESIVRVFDVEGVPVAVVNHDGSFYAFSGKCTHEDYSFNYTRVRAGDRIICSSHQAVFELATGKVISWPDLDDLTIYGVQVEDGEVLVNNEPLQVGCH